MAHRAVLGSIVAILFGACFSSAYAGRYVAVYSHPDCLVEMQGPLGIYWTKTYSASGGGCSGSGTAGDPPGGSNTGGGPGWVQCSGEITATFTWDNEGDQHALPPSVVIISEIAKATWAGDGGSCDNGLGDAATGGPNHGVSQGTFHWIKHNPGQQFVLTCSPSASAYMGGAFSPNAVATVSYQAIARPLKIEMSGIVERDGVAHSLIGARAGAWVVAHGDSSPAEVSFSNYRWTIPGDIFKQFVVNAGAGTGYAVPVPSIDYTSSSPQWCWKDDADSLSLSCSVNVYVNGAFIENVTLNRTVEVWAPVWEMTAQTTGVVTYTGGLNNAVQAGGPNPLSNPGVQFTGRASTPSPFHDPWGGDGEWMFAQLCTLDRYTLVGTGLNLLHYEKHFTDLRLDNTWGYDGGGPFQATWPDQYDTDDSPTWSLPPLSTSYRIHDEFWMYLMYRPPIGAGREWVPLGKLNWKWNAVGSRFLPLLPWPTPINGAVTCTASIATSTHPFWSYVYNNNESCGPYLGP